MFRSCCLAMVILGVSVSSRAGASDPLTTRQDEVGKQLNEWFTAGSAAGFGKLQYENRDGEHSLLPPGLYPGLKRYTPTAAELKARQNIGPAYTHRKDATLGNCSMASSAETGGSLPRIYMTMEPQGSAFLFQSYFGNNFIIYPEHQDHDVGFNGVDGWGDLYPSNQPALLISQGSSHTDMPFLKEWLAAAAALKPEIQAFLIDKKILIPTLNALFRQSNKMVQIPSAYFTGKAHPVVFDGSQIDEMKMVTAAQMMTEMSIPPLAFVEVLSERTAAAGVDFFERPGITTEKLADTPVCVSRIFRSSADVYEMKLSSRKSQDVQKKPLTVRWVLLQGDPDKVKIEPSADGAEATVKVQWHDSMASSSGTPIRTHRVDIGLFVSNPVADSAPAIVSFFMLPNEKRFYDGSGKLTEICYEAGNEDMGLPRTDDDSRWISFIEWLETRPRDALLLDEEQRKAIMTAGAPLIEQRYALKRLQAKPEDKDAAMAKEKQLQQAVTDLLKLELPGEGQPSVRSAIVDAINRLADQPGLVVERQDELLSAAVATADEHLIRDVKQAIWRLTDWGIFIEDGDGRLSTARPVAALGEPERFYLRSLNLTLIAKVIMPQFLRRSAAPAFSDVRLTAKKPWRDVYRYDDQGARTGWLRYHDGKVTAFTADGRMKPSLTAKDSAAVPVIYEELDGRLVFKAK